MDAREIVNTWLAKINPADAGMVLNQYGQCQLISSGRESCIVYVPLATSMEFHLIQDICALPLHCEMSVYRAVLKLNVPQAATRGGALGFDEHTGNIVFSYAREIALTDIRVFCSVLENFMNAAQDVGRQVKSLVSAVPDAVRSHRASRSALLDRMSRIQP